MSESDLQPGSNSNEARKAHIDEGYRRCAGGTRLVSDKFRERWLELWLAIEVGGGDEMARRVSRQVLDEGIS